MALFESYERRIEKINAVLAQYGIQSIEEAKAICDEKGIDPYKMCEETQPICFENAKWAYVVGAAIAIKKGCTNAADAAEAIGEGIPTYSVDIPIRTSSPDFAFFDPKSSFLGRRIEALDGELEFTALNLGNPHIVAAVEEIDMTLLEQLGERVKSLKREFPHGVNVSLYKVLSATSIFVATYERGAGITLSCGTAMTASSTAAVLLGYVNRGERIEVFNRGGKVACRTAITDGSIITTLEGNATFEWRGEARFDGTNFAFDIEAESGEAATWNNFVESLNR